MKKEKGIRRGFTLIEILLVIGLIAILAGIVIVAINPARQYAKARDATRWSDVNAILNAIHQYAIDNSGVVPSGITTSETQICRTGASDCTGLLDLSVLTDSELYLVSIPIDPICSTPSGGCSSSGTEYTVKLTSSGRVQVTASESEIDEVYVVR